MSYVVYGRYDVSCAVGVSPADDGDDALPFLAFFKMSSIPSGRLNDVVSGEDAQEMIDVIRENGGFVVYFDNPDSAERFSRLSSIVFSLASRGEWANREEIVETIN